MNTFHSIILDVFALLVVAAVFYNAVLSGIRFRPDRIFCGLLSLNGGMLVLDIAVCRLGASAATLRCVFISLMLLMMFLCCGMWFVYTDYWTGGTRHPLLSNFLYILPALLELVLIALNFRFGWLFSIETNGAYTPGPLYVGNAVFIIFYLFGSTAKALFALRRAADVQNKKDLIYIASFAVIPSVGIILRILYPGIVTVAPPLTLSLLIVYLNLQRRKLDEELYRQAQREKALTESRTATMLSQIQPHFLYNALSVIVYYCDEDPAQAKKITLVFSDYLRENLNSLKQKRCVPFASELRHVRNYLYLEKYRFEDKLEVVYDIETENFLLPAMTVQPLVENAVRHGLFACEHGGRVTISSAEREDCFEVRVSDNGAGFDPHNPLPGTGVGIERVRESIEAMSGGTLEIKSEPSTGTVATIRIPKGEEDCAYTRG